MENRFKKGDVARIVSSSMAALVGKLVEIEEIDGGKCVVTFDEDEDVKVRMKVECDRLELVSAANRESNDMVNSPNHYNRNGIEVFDIMRAFYGDDAYEHFCLCSAQKYVTRCQLKGKYLEDLKKARKCIDKILEIHHETI